MVVQVIGVGDRKVEFVLLQKRRDQIAVFVRGDRQEEYVLVVFIFRDGLFEQRHLGQAGAAPRGPEINYDYLAALLVELERRAVEPGQREFQRVVDAIIDVRQVQLRQPLFSLLDKSVMSLQQSGAEADLRPVLRRIELSDLAPQRFQIDPVIGVERDGESLQVIIYRLIDVLALLGQFAQRDGRLGQTRRLIALRQIGASLVVGPQVGVNFAAQQVDRSDTLLLAVLPLRRTDAPRFGAVGDDALEPFDERVGVSHGLGQIGLRLAFAQHRDQVGQRLNVIFVAGDELFGVNNAAVAVAQFHAELVKLFLDILAALAFRVFFQIAFEVRDNLCLAPARRFDGATEFIIRIFRRVYGLRRVFRRAGRFRLLLTGVVLGERGGDRQRQGD